MNTSPGDGLPAANQTGEPDKNTPPHGLPFGLRPHSSSTADLPNPYLHNTWYRNLKLVEEKGSHGGKVRISTGTSGTLVSARCLPAWRRGSRQVPTNTTSFPAGKTCHHLGGVA